MNRDQIIESIKRDSYIEKLVSKQASPAYLHIREDIEAELYLMICERGGKLEEICARDGMDGVRKYVSGIVRNQLYSKRSNIYYNYLKTQQAESNIDDHIFSLSEPCKSPRTFSEIAQLLDPVEAFILQTYIECDYKIRRTAREFDIPVGMMSGIIKRIMRQATNTPKAWL